MPRVGLRPLMSGFTATASFLSPPSHKVARIGMYLTAWRTGMGDDPMTTVKGAHLFGGPKRMRRALARERAMELAQKYKEGNSTAHEGGDAAALQIIADSEADASKPS